MSTRGKKFYSPGLMDLSDYRLERTELGDGWDAVVAASPQGSLFATTAFLRGAGGKMAPWLCRKNNEVKAAVLVHESDDGADSVYESLVVYSGIMFAAADPNQNHAQVMSEEFRVASAVVAQLTSHYGRISFQTHPDFVDIRPFLWHNYGQPGPKFQVDVRYTVYLSIAGGEGLDDNPIYQAANKSRRQEIRYGRKAEVTVEEGLDLSLFRTMVTDTFRRQGVQVPQLELDRKASVLDGLNRSGMVRMFTARTVDGTPTSLAAMGLHRGRGYYLFGANDTGQRDNYGGTMVLFEALNALARSGIGEVDMEGVNSPRRGYFKLSFGGTMRSYYHLTLGGKKSP
jgi:hypothetical protein